MMMPVKTGIVYYNQVPVVSILLRQHSNLSKNDVNSWDREYTTIGFSDVTEYKFGENTIAAQKQRRKNPTKP
jgi:hypothetical protein